MRAARRLKLLHKWGVGVDNFDLATARELGITVARTTGSNAGPVRPSRPGPWQAAQCCW
jgi:D-3-phosphoglycerate dehydrogenase